MAKNRKLYRVIIQEKISETAYIYAEDKADAARIAIEEDIDSRSNQDFEQKILRVTRVYKKDYPIGILINE